MPFVIEYDERHGLLAVEVVDQPNNRAETILAGTSRIVH